MLRSRLSPLALAAVATAIAVFPATSAFAHDELAASTPEAGSTVTTQPEVVAVTMAEDLTTLDPALDGFAIEVTDSAGLHFEDRCLAVTGATLSTGALLGDAGEYTVTWQVVSNDGHPVSGSYTFTWAPDASVTVFGTGSPQTPDVCLAATSGGAAEPMPISEGPSAEPTTSEPASDQPSAPLSAIATVVGLVVLVAGVGAYLARKRATGK